MKGNLALCASGFRNRAWVCLVCKMAIKPSAALRMTGVILLLQANERRCGEDDHMAILLDSFERNSQS